MRWIRNTCWWYFLLATTLSLNGQEIPNNPTKLQQLSDLAFQFRERNADSALFYAQKALNAARESGSSQYEAYSLSDLGTYYKQQLRYDSAIFFFHESLQVRLQHLSPKDVASGYNQLGSLFHLKESYENAIQYFELGLKVLEKQPNPMMEAILTSGKGMAYFRTGKRSAGLTMLENSLTLYESFGDSLAIAKELMNLGNFYLESGQIKRAIAVNNRAFELLKDTHQYGTMADVMINQAAILQTQGSLDKAVKKLSAAGKLSEQHGFQDHLLAIYSNMGLIFAQQQKYDQAEQYQLKHLEIARRLQIIKSMTTALQNLASTRIQRGEFASALPLLREAHDTLQHKNWALLLQSNYAMQAETYAGLHDYARAYSFKSRASGYRDSLDLSFQKVRELSDQIELNRQERSQILAKAVLQEQQLEAERAKSYAQTIALWALCILVVLIIIIILGWYFTRLKRLTTENELSKQREINLKKEQQIGQLTRDSELKVLRTRMETQDRERGRIARDLHDRLGSGLAVVQINFDAIQDHLDLLPPYVQSNFQKASELLEIACDTTREVARNIQAGELAQNGLVIAIQNFCREITDAFSTEIALSCEAYDVPDRLPQQLEREIFAMLRTLIENILRHAQAKTGIIQMSCTSDDIQITVEDDGAGFDESDPNFEPGLGIANVKKRSQDLGGQALFDSTPGQGTFVTLILPLNTPQS